MSTYEFWYDEEELLDAYVKGYSQRTDYNAWLGGYYNYIAYLTAQSNMWGGDDGKKDTYPSYDDIKSNNKEDDEIIKPNGNNDYHFLSHFY